MGPSLLRCRLQRRLHSLFDQVDLSKNFYFSWVSVPCYPSDLSYSYDITNTLQKNLTTPDNERLWNARFMWNYHLLQPAFDLENPKERSQWVLPMIHGSFDQTSGLSKRSLLTLRNQRLLSNGVSDPDRTKVPLPCRCALPDAWRE